MGVVLRVQVPPRWWNSTRFLNTVLTTRYFDELGLPRIAS